MTSPLSVAARRLDDLAAELLPGGAPAPDLGPAVFGADLPGRLGTLGRELYARWSGELAERERAAGALAARLIDTAATLRTAGDGYAGVEEQAARRGDEVGGGFAGADHGVAGRGDGVGGGFAGADHGVAGRGDEVGES